MRPYCSIPSSCVAKFVLSLNVINYMDKFTIYVLILYLATIISRDNIILDFHIAFTSNFRLFALLSYFNSASVNTATKSHVQHPEKR